jgi:hypothetical protein
VCALLARVVVLMLTYAGRTRLATFGTRIDFFTAEVTLELMRVP